MPETIGDYTALEIAKMDQPTFDAAKANNFLKQRPAAAGEMVGSSVPKTVPQPSRDVWAKQRRSSGEDFVCPSGQTCRLRPVTPEALIEVGILDQVTRLEGLADQLVQRAEGEPPKSDTALPSREDMELLLKTINIIVPIAVVEPKVFRDDDELAGPEAIRVSDIDLEDRMAIMERSLRKLKLLDSFRYPR